MTARMAGSFTCLVHGGQDGWFFYLFNGMTARMAGSFTCLMGPYVDLEALASNYAGPFVDLEALRPNLEGSKSCKNQF